MQVDETEVAALNESLALAAKELLLTAGLRTRGSTTMISKAFQRNRIKCGRSEPNLPRWWLDGLMGGSVGSPCDVFSWAVGHPMA